MRVLKTLARKIIKELLFASYKRWFSTKRGLENYLETVVLDEVNWIFISALFIQSSPFGKGATAKTMMAEVNKFITSPVADHLIAQLS